MDKHTICLLNDSFPPIIDGVANAVVNYAENIEKHHGHAMVVTPAVPGADDSGFPLLEDIWNILEFIFSVKIIQLFIFLQLI